MKKLSAVLLLASTMLLFAAPVLAQTPTTPGSQPTPTTPGPNPTPTSPTRVTVKIENPFKFGDSLYDVVKAVVNNVIMPIGGVLCVLAFIYAGFRYVTAGGNPTKIAQANLTLLYAAIGTAVLLGAWVIAQVVENTVKSLMS